MKATRGLPPGSLGRATSSPFYWAGGRGTNPAALGVPACEELCFESKQPNFARARVKGPERRRGTSCGNGPLHTSVQHTAVDVTSAPNASTRTSFGVSDRSGLREGADRIPFGLGEVIDKLPHFADAHLPWMVLAVESDEAFTPISHGRGRRLGVPLMACGVAQLVKQAWRLYYSRRRLEKSAGAHGCPQGRTYQWGQLEQVYTMSERSVKWKSKNLGRPVEIGGRPYCNGNEAEIGRPKGKRGHS